MTVVHKPWRKGIRKVSAIASAVANNTPVTLYQLTAGRTCVVRKLHIYNDNAAQSVVQLGTGGAGAFTQRIPGFLAMPDMETIYREDDLLEYEFTADITVQASVAAADPADVEVMVEVEEFQGPTG